MMFQAEGQGPPEGSVMSDENPFHDLLRRIRAGDEQAATELVRSYEPVIRRVIHMRLRDSRLRRLFDSLDICQSVLGSFFVRAALGQYELETPDQLVKLLAAMARNKLANQARQQQASPRDHRRQAALTPDKLEALAAGPTPSREVEARELLTEARRRLPADERRLLELREQGCEWGEIATTVGGTPEALRKRLARAVDEVAQQLGLDEGSQ
jgi:RNA polymerase sigma factor (sigma-70 family)